MAATREVDLLYRKWSGQSTAQTAHQHKDERETRMAVVDARVRELAELGWLYEPRK
ncbi:hypothetical protein HCC61_17365 [Streptomyces sp. HNM0575]|uniref:hypothetical protein n=1 Tax=Streptomyces sp. HNM0575 TaxID=2716338 RepID=UPI00145CB6F7|nr:hypothetical protein [Streptomyces sp. HNM0575]